jgi:hypothetical protein
VYGIFVGIFLLTVTIFVLVSTGSLVAVVVMWLLVAVVIAVLVYYGFINLESTETPAAATTPAAANVVPGGPLVGSEVFHIGDSQFTYDEASAVCAAYGSQLATLEQILEAYNKGAEWCSYGWSAGGMALYPTQKATWDELQREIDPGKRTACGRPGVNGGYFDPLTKFGVNCFGFKPKGDFTPPAPVPGVDKAAFDSNVNKFKAMLNSIVVSPWSRQQWSGYNYGQQFQQNLGKLTESFVEYGDAFAEAPTTSSAYSAAPFGLKGEAGPRGEKGDPGVPGPAGPIGPTGAVGPFGPKGDVGEPGPRGADSTIPGPPGPTGPRGFEGKQGQASTVPGPTGPFGPMGPTGAPGRAADKGDPGPTGPRGLDGKNGVDGRNGVDGKQGPTGAAGRLDPSLLKNLTVDKLTIGDTLIEDVGSGLQISDPTKRPIRLWMGGQGAAAHSSMMTTKKGGGEAWFGY